MKRFQMDIEDEQMEIIEKIQKDGKFSTKKDVLESAIALLGWCLDESKKGNKIASIEKRKQSVLLMPCFTRVNK
jgi:hypothetical protein